MSTCNPISIRCLVGSRTKSKLFKSSYHAQK